MSEILIIGEGDGERVKEATLELVTLGRELAEATGWSLGGAVPGAEPAAAAENLAGSAGIPVLAVKDPALASYNSDAWVTAIASACREAGARVVLVTHGAQGWDWAPRLAARLDGAPATELTAIEKDDEGLVFTRKVFGGKLEMRFRLEGSPIVATVQRGARPAAEQASETGSVEEHAPGLDASTIRTRLVEVQEAAGGKVDLTQADVIVSGGRALGGPEKFDIIRELAEALGGQVGASRPVTDSGWLPPEHQVGSSGVTVKPKLYVACGISGAIQHVVGMKGSDYIVAINKDEKAPIFEVADVGVVGDLFELVPAITKAVREARAR